MRILAMETGSANKQWMPRLTFWPDILSQKQIVVTKNSGQKSEVCFGEEEIKIFVELIK